MLIACLQHVPFEGPGTIGTWARERGHSFAPVRLFAGDPLPAVESLDGLVVMGGPMSVHDEKAFGWLVPEKRLIGEAIARDRLVLGVCLGAQLVAEVLGARVYAGGGPEIGWFDVRRTAAAATSRLCASLPSTFPSFHWHGDTFDIPAGAMHTAESVAFRHQAFELAPAVLALQFHLEATPDGVAALIDAGRSELSGGPHVQSEADIGRPDRPFAAMAAVLWPLLDRLERAAPT